MGARLPWNWNEMQGVLDSFLQFERNWNDSTLFLDSSLFLTVPYFLEMPTIDIIPSSAVISFGVQSLCKRLLDDVLALYGGFGVFAENEVIYHAIQVSTDLLSSKKSLFQVLQSYS